MPTNSMKAKEFEAIINSSELVFVDFWAEWCAPCKQFASVYERVAEQNPLIKFTKVNIEEESELADSLEIRSIPHLMVFKQGILIYSEAGSMPESVFKDLVSQALNADVSEICEKIEKGEL